MHQIRGQNGFPGERRCYRAGPTVIDVWYRTLSDDYIEIFIETIQPSDYRSSANRTYFDGDQQIGTTAIARHELRDLTWEEFLISPEDFLMEILL